MPEPDQVPARPDPSSRAEVEARGRTWLAHAETRLLPAARAAMRRYLATAAAAVLRADTSTITAAGDVDPDDLPPNLDAWPPRATWDQAVTEHLLPAGERVWRTAWTRHLGDDEQAADPGQVDEYLAEYLSDTTTRLTGAAWPDDVYDAVRATVAASLEAGEGLAELRARIAELLGLDRWAYRAKFIARNESLAALNAGAYAAGVHRTTVFEEPLFKKWLAVPDTSTRLAHRDVDGTVVPAAATFDVGGERLRYPHDPRGSLSNTANCRCLLLWVDETEFNEDDLVAGVHHREGITMGHTQGDTLGDAPAKVGDGLVGDPWALPTDEEITAWTEAGDLSDELADQPADDRAGDVAGDTDGDTNTGVGEGLTAAAADFTPSGAPTAAKRRRAEASRHALPGGRYPIENSSDLDKAIAAVGRAKGGETGRRLVRRHIMRQARRLGLAQKIPATWNADGSLKTPARTTPKRMAAASTAPAYPRETGEMSWAERVAANVPAEPDPDAFRQPSGPRGTKMHVVNDQGWVAGYIADWDALHRVYKVPPPRDPYGGGYPKFHRHRVRTNDGGIVLTGPIATNGHGNTGGTDLWAVMRHYDDPRYVAANVRVSEDDHGIWASGSLRHGVTPFQVALLDTYEQSGHWMPGPSGAAEELVASCCVTVEAFERNPQLATVATLAASVGLTTPTLDQAQQQSVFDNDGRCIVLTAAGIVAPPPASSNAVVDPFQLMRGLRAAEAVDREITAARRRITAIPAVDAAADRIRAGRN